MKKSTLIDNYKIGFEEKESDIFDSKVGGMPYWDLSKPYPVMDNEQMILLAQINFDKEKFNDIRLPNNGILQFFVRNNWRDKGRFVCKTVYHKNINYNLTLDDLKMHGFLTCTDQGINIGVSGEFKMNFVKQTEFISAEDFLFDNWAYKTFEKLYTKEQFDFNDIYDYNWDEFRDEFTLSSGSKIFGYPYFYQEDPRIDMENGKNLYLLFQLDAYQNLTEYNSKMRLFDSVFNVFIDVKDLQNNNFDNLFINLDFS